MKDWRMSLHGITEPRDQSSPKSLKTCYAPMPFTVPTFIALSQTMYEKSVTKDFAQPLVLWHPRVTPGPKFTNLGTDVQQGPDYQCETFCPLLTTCLRDLLPNFVYFSESMTDGPMGGGQKTVNNMSQYTTQRQQFTVSSSSPWREQNKISGEEISTDYFHDVSNDNLSPLQQLPVTMPQNWHHNSIHLLVTICMYFKSNEYLSGPPNEHQISIVIRCQQHNWLIKSGTKTGKTNVNKRSIPYINENDNWKSNYSTKYYQSLQYLFKWPYFPC